MKYRLSINPLKKREAARPAVSSLFRRGRTAYGQ
jgi:hypothetical protein